LLNEILEQPRGLADTLRGRTSMEEGDAYLDGVALDVASAEKIARIQLIACGTSWHAGLVGKHWIEALSRIPVEVDLASEYRYRDPIVDGSVLCVAISQSGETADTLAALTEAKQRGALALGVVNVVGSSIARETDAGVYLRVGPEIGVASTKAFTGQVMVNSMLATFIGRRRYLSQEYVSHLLRELEQVPSKIERALAWSERIRAATAKYIHRENWLFLGRGVNYPVALEGALKLKEISYIHAEGMPAAEMKHGPIALIDNGMPVVFVATRNSQYEKVLSNIEEVRSRGGHVIAVATEGDDDIKRLAQEVFYVPDCIEMFQPLLTVIPLQLLAYHAAVMRGKDVDKPRNLAKSVTVE
jgi:glucosamine--fructose-6-phosphate aminotransferase (isomerizing)